jgi:hypothetical protein
LQNFTLVSKKLRTYDVFETAEKKREKPPLKILTIEVKISPHFSFYCLSKVLANKFLGGELFEELKSA